jgi:hypothetical protein
MGPRGKAGGCREHEIVLRQVRGATAKIASQYALIEFLVNDIQRPLTSTLSSWPISRPTIQPAMVGENATGLVPDQAATPAWEEEDFIEALARLENLQHQVSLPDL